MLHYLIESGGSMPVSYFNSNFGPLRHVRCFSGYPHSVLQKVLLDVSSRAAAEETPVECIHHCLDNSLQGVILPGLGTGVLGFDVCDGALPNIFGVTGVKSLATLRAHKAYAGALFAKAREFHNEQEKIYIANMHFDVAEAVTEETIRSLIGTGYGLEQGREVHRFFGAATPEGNVDYVLQLTEEIPHRYYVKGRSGTGKSTFLKRIAAAALGRGFLVETYHCALDPQSVDMVVVRALGICLFDSTAPHEYFPSRAGDEVIDLYRLCVTPGTDEKYGAQLEVLRGGYKTLVGEARACLGEAQKAAEAFEATLPRIDPELLEEVSAALQRSLFEV